MICENGFVTLGGAAAATRHEAPHDQVLADPGLGDDPRTLDDYVLIPS